MKKLLIASTSKKVREAVENTCNNQQTGFDPIFADDTESALSVLDYEIPEVKILDFTSTQINCETLLNAIHSDPWLHNGGIIAIVGSQKEVSELEAKKDLNILLIQTNQTFCHNVSRLLRILGSNQNMLFNRGLQEKFGGIEKGEFVSENNPLDIKLYASLIVNYLYCKNIINDDGRFSLQTTLMELLVNALEHGNCKISYEEKSQCLLQAGNILDLIQKKLEDPEIAKKRIHISYQINQESSSFTIRDDGDGFDWRSKIDRNMADVMNETHGRGIALSRTLVKSMHYNDKGNEITFEIKNQIFESNNIPGFMSELSIIPYSKHQIVCQENEPSNDLYFIVEGRFGVYVNGKLVSVLTPDDMFIGEMAFLLNDKRTACLMSVDEGKLIKIPKTAFMSLIRKNPHYGIFISKLLAQRLSKANKKTIALTHKVEELQNLVPIEA